MKNIKHLESYNRGATDSYYHGARVPNYYTEDSMLNGVHVKMVNMTPEQIEAYFEGYDWNELYGSKKDFS